MGSSVAWRAETLAKTKSSGSWRRHGGLSASSPYFDDRSAPKPADCCGMRSSRYSEHRADRNAGPPGESAPCRVPLTCTGYHRVRIRLLTPLR